MMELLKFFGVVIMGLVVLELIATYFFPQRDISSEPCKMHNWDYDMDSGKYVCIKCRGKSGEM